MQQEQGHKKNILDFLNQFVLFNFQYFSHHLFFLVFFIFGAGIYLNFFLFKEKFLIINVIFIIICGLIIFSINKIHNKYFFRIQKFDFLILNINYIFYIFFFFGLGFLAPNLHSKLFFEKNSKQIDHKIFIKNEKIFMVHDVVKFDPERRYVCLLIKEFGENSENLFNKNAKIRFCSHSNKLSNLENFSSFKDVLLKIENFEINPIRESLFEYDYKIKRSYFFKNIIGQIYSNNIKLLRKGNENFKTTIWTKINDFRYSKSIKFVQDFGFENGGIIAALIFGTRIFISENISENMKKSSIFHLVAISGLHISFISILFFQFIFLIFLLIAYNFCPNIPYFALKKTALAISLLAAFSYLLISGFSVSAQRAFLMFIVYIIFNLFGKQIIFSKNIFLSVIIFVFFNPSEILNPGLQMSFFAVIGLFLFFHSNFQSSILNFLSKANFSNWIKNLLYLLTKTITGSFGPHFFTMPISGFYFSQITTYTFLANIIAVPLMSLFIAPLIICYLFLSFTNFEFPKNFILIFLNLGFEALNKTAKFFSKNAPFNSIFIEQISKKSFIFFLLGISMLFIWRKNFKFISFSILFFLAIFFAKIDDLTPDLFILKEKNSINYLFFNKKQSNIYYFIERIDENKKFSRRINYLINRKFQKRFNFIQIDEKEFLEFKKNFNFKEIMQKMEKQDSISIFLHK